MKKILASVLCLCIFALSFAGCSKTSGGYKLVDVPKELSIDAEVLSEDLKDNLLNIDEDYQLLYGIPEENLYIYAIRSSVAQGVLVKFDGRIQYFPWSFVPQLAQPEAYVADYNGDGVKDIAFTYLESVGIVNYNETLHILLAGDKKLTDCIYSAEKAASEASSHMSTSQLDKNAYSVTVDGKTENFSLKGNGELLGVRCDDVQDFTLGETIKLEINPGLVFKTKEDPVYSVFKYYADIQLKGDVCVQANPMIQFT